MRLFETGRENASENGIRRWWVDRRELLRSVQDAGVAHVHTSLRWRAWMRDASFVRAIQAHGCRVLVHLHGWERDWFDGSRSQRRVASVLSTLRSATRVLCADPTLVERLRGFGLSERDVRWMPNAYDAAEVPSGPRQPREDVLFLGRVVPEKRVVPLVQGFAHVLRRRPRARLVIAGEGPHLPTVRRHVEALGLGARACLAGWVEGPAKRRWLSRASVVALPSTNEAAPLALIEAMASGVPVVAARTPSIERLVGSCGVLLSTQSPRTIAEGILQALDDPSLAAGSAHRVREMEAGRVASRWCAHYDEAERA